MKKILLIILIALPGCSPLSHREQVLLGLVIGANTADAYTTIEAVEPSNSGHFHELNPILGKHPDSGNVILFKAVVVGVLYGLGELFPEKREGIYTIGIVTSGSAAVWNWSRVERYK